MIHVDQSFPQPFVTTIFNQPTHSLIFFLFSLVGNKWYRSCIAKHAKAYRDASDRYRKSFIVSSIIESVKERCSANGYGGFVKQDPTTDRWYQVDDKTTREKVSHALRESIKVLKRKEARAKHCKHTLRAKFQSNGPMHLQIEIPDYDDFVQQPLIETSLNSLLLPAHS